MKLNTQVNYLKTVFIGALALTFPGNFALFCTLLTAGFLERRWIIFSSSSRVWDCLIVTKDPGWWSEVNVFLNKFSHFCLNLGMVSSTVQLPHCQVFNRRHQHVISMSYSLFCLKWFYFSKHLQLVAV